MFRLYCGHSPLSHIQLVLKVLLQLVNCNPVLRHRIPVTDGYRLVFGGFEIARRLLPQTVLFASGDMFTCEQSLEVVRKTAVDGITPARGLMHNPWLIRDIESACRGEKPPERNVVPFLLRLVELVAESPVWRTGLILEISRNVWGSDSERFKSLTKDPSPDAMLRNIRAMV